MTQLQEVDHGGGDARCIHCGALAVGPCARCEAPVCGDCCVLTKGGTKVYAICLGCNEEAGNDLRRGWLTVIGWLAVPILGLLAAVLLISRC